jgi:hypothetical protein
MARIIATIGREDDVFIVIFGGEIIPSVLIIMNLLKCSIINLERHAVTPPQPYPRGIGIIEDSTATSEGTKRAIVC